MTSPSIDRIGVLARDWRQLERTWIAQEGPVAVGALGPGSRRAIEKEKDAALNALRAAIDAEGA